MTLHAMTSVAFCGQRDVSIDSLFGAVKRNVNYHQPKNAELSERSRKVDLSRLAFHCDQAATDLIALLSVTAAKEGGESKWVSGIAIHNELLRRGRKVNC